MPKQLFGLSVSLILLLLLLLQLPLHAQSYRPFIPHMTYMYECQYESPNHSTDIRGAYALKIDSTYSDGSDSIFRFNQIGRGSGQVWINQDNIMGGKMIEKPNGDYQFIANEIDTILLRTQVPLQTSWIYDSTTMASLTARTELDVLGQLDSALIISLSNGDSLIVSKSFGLVNAKAILPIEEEYYFEAYKSVRGMKSPLRLIGIDELGLGQSYFDKAAIYDFEIGDTYLFRSSASCGSDIFSYRWKRVLDRRQSQDGDTVYYDWEEERIIITPYWAAPLPPSHPGDTTHLGFSYFTEAIVLTDSAFLPRLLSYEYDIPSGYHLRGPYYHPKWNERLSYIYQSLGSPGPNAEYYFSFEGGAFYALTEELGETDYSLSVSVPIECLQLLGYQKSTDSAGFSIQPQMLVSNETELSISSLKLYPNPSNSFVQIEFCTEQSILNWQLKLFDTQGRVVHQLSGFEASNCLSNRLDTRALAKGIYTLQMIAFKGNILHASKLNKY